MSGLALGGSNYSEETSDAKLEGRLQLDCTDKMCRPSSSECKAFLTQQLCSIARTHLFILDIYARWYYNSDSLATEKAGTSVT